jgi:hypothetical protein
MTQVIRDRLCQAEMPQAKQCLNCVVGGSCVEMQICVSWASPHLHSYLAPRASEVITDPQQCYLSPTDLRLSERDGSQTRCVSVKAEGWLFLEALVEGGCSRTGQGTWKVCVGSGKITSGMTEWLEIGNSYGEEFSPCLLWRNDSIDTV